MSAGTRKEPTAPGVVFTPAHLARRLVAGLAAPPAGLLDPACGDGALLVAALAALGGGPGAALRLYGIEIDPELARRARERVARAAGVSARSLERHIRTGDALDPRTEWAPGTAVVANPPWVSFSGRQAPRDPRRRPAAGPGWPSLQGAFLARIARHVAEERTAARVIVPAAVLEQEGYGPVREAVTAGTRLAGPPEELGEEAFRGVLGPAVVLGLVPGAGGGAGSSLPWLFADAGALGLTAALAGFPRLAGAFADPGVHTGNAAARLVADRPGPGRAPLRRGRDLACYRLAPAGAWLDVALEPTPPLCFRRGPRARYAAFPILLRQTADRPIAALHRPAGYFRNSLLACRGAEELDPAFVVAVLNSPVAAAWHRLSFRDARQRSFPQVKVSHLASLPFPFLRRDEARAAHDGIVRRVRSLRPGRPGFAGAVDALGLRVVELFELPPDVAQRALAVAGAGATPGVRSRTGRRAGPS